MAPEMAMGRVYVRNHGFPPLAVSSSINSSRKFYAHPSSNSFMLCRCQRTLLLCADLVLTPAREGGRPDSKAVSKVGYSKLILTFRIPNILSIILRLKLTSLK